MNKIEVKFTGNVHDLLVELEGTEIGLAFDGISEWTRVLENFSISGNLDLVMRCKGLNGTFWNLELSVDGTGPKKYSGTIQKGYSIIRDEIAISLK